MRRVSPLLFNVDILLNVVQVRLGHNYSESTNDDRGSSILFYLSHNELYLALM